MFKQSSVIEGFVYVEYIDQTGKEMNFITDRLVVDAGGVRANHVIYDPIGAGVGQGLSIPANNIETINYRNHMHNDFDRLYRKALAETTKKFAVDYSGQSNEYVEHGLAIFIQGRMVVGIHPNNLENNLEALKNGMLKFDWEVLSGYAKKQKEERP